MARKTKHEAQLTRHRILDAAERAFEQHGVSGTSLDDIARAAGLTRGAIYWHFQGKADLFNAMMARVVMPWEDPAGGPAHTARDLTLDQLRDHLVAMLRQFVDDPQRRRVFDILLHKVDHVGEMQAVRQRHLEVRQACWAQVQGALGHAKRRGEWSGRLSARAAALGLHALVNGLLQNWMLDPDAFDLERVGSQALGVYLASLALSRVERPAHFNPL